MKVVDSQIITMFLIEGHAVVPSQQADKSLPAVMVPARDALKEAYAHGWQPHSWYPIGLGPSAESNVPEIRLVWHLVKYEDEPVVAVKRGRPAMVEPNPDTN